MGIPHAHSLPLLLLMVATGCGGRGDSPPGGGASGNAEAARSANRDPCSLITREEAEAILGRPLTVAPVTGGPPTCEYKPATGTRLNGFTITVYWTGGRERMGARPRPTMWAPLSTSTQPKDT